MRKFDQYCPVAHALTLVGERWSLLIVRELLHGPKRYTDLAHGLPGIGTNILAARLRELEQAGIVQKRTLPPPAASAVYELTEYGAELREALYALARWGARTIGPPGPDDELYPEWGVNALPALFDADAARGLTETYALVVEGDAFTAPYSAPSAGPPPWDLYEFTPKTAFGVATAEPYGATRWHFQT